MHFCVHSKNTQSNWVEKGEGCVVVVPVKFVFFDVEWSFFW